MFWAIYLAVLFAAFAMMVREGLWSNSITLVNIIISGLVAFGFYAPITVYVDEYLNGQFTYLLDFVVIWFLYAVSMVICRAVTGAASKTRMRFKYPIDPIGGPVAGLVAAWVLSSIALATLHTSPMAKNAFGGKLVRSTDVSSASFISSPDAAWLGFVEKLSAPTAFGSGGTGQFKAESWVRIYEDHRERFERADGIKVRRG